MKKIGMRLGLFLRFLFFVSTCVSAKEPEEIWRDPGKLRGLKGQSFKPKNNCEQTIGSFH